MSKNHKYITIARWFVYTISLLICSTQYYQIGVFILLFAAAIMPVKVDLSSRRLLIRESVLYVFIVMIYYASWSWYIITNPENFFSLPVSIAVLVILVPLLPDLIRLEIDSYRGRI